MKTQSILHRVLCIVTVMRFGKLQRNGMCDEDSCDESVNNKQFGVVILTSYSLLCVSQFLKL